MAFCRYLALEHKEAHSKAGAANEGGGSHSAKLFDEKL